MKYLNLVWAIVIECIKHPFEEGYLVIGNDGKTIERMNDWKRKINRTGVPGPFRKRIVP